MKNATLSLLRLTLLLWLGTLASAWAQCGAPTGLTVSNITGTTATLSFTPAAGALGYIVSYTTPSVSGVTTVSPNPTSSPVALTNLTPVTSYTITVIPLCAGGTTGSGATVFFVTTALNDEPCTAVALPVGATCQPTTGTTTTATTTPANGYPAVGCQTLSNPADVWYTFTTAATGPASTGVRLTLAGTGATLLRALAATSCTGPFTELGCVSPAVLGQNPPDLVLGSLTPSTTYYVLVASSLTSRGSFTICATTPPACGDPINVAVGSLTPTSAQLSFSPGPGNLSYTVSLTPTGGTATTLTPAPTTAPVALTALLPLTTYTLTLQANCASGGPGSVITRTFTTGNPQDEPAGAVPIPLSATCQPITSTNAQATTTTPSGYANPGCGAAAMPADVWLTVTTAATGLASQGVTLTVASPGPNPTVFPAGQVRLFSSTGGAAGPFTQLGCSSSGAAGTNAPPLIVGGLSPSTTYYVSVSGYISMETRGAFTICATPAPACPAPLALTAQLQSLSSVLLGWTPNGAGGTYTVEYGLAGFAPGTGAAGAVVVPGLTGSSYLAQNLTPGQSYEFYVTRDCGAAGSSPRVGPLAFRPQALGNDEICGALALTIGAAPCAQPTAGTLAGATLSASPNIPPNVGVCVQQTTARDVWYQFTTAATGPASTSVLIEGTGDAGGLTVVTGPSCAGPLTCVGAAGNQALNVGQPAPPLVLRSLTPSITYYLKVGSVRVFPGNADPGGGAFTLCLSSPPPPCETPINGQITNITSTTADVAFNLAPAGNTAYTLVVSGGPGSGTQTVTSVPATLTGLAPATTYTVRVTPTCAGGQGASVLLQFTTTPPGPVNDLCSGALPIACGQTVTGNSDNARPSTFPAGNTCAISGSRGVFYRFVGTGDSVLVRTCSPATDYGVTVAVLQGTCAALTCVGGSIGDLACAPFTRGAYKFLTQAGTNYYIYLTGNSIPRTGNYSLTLTCISPACAAPSQVTATAITATSASVGFTPATGTPANGYVVTATPYVIGSIGIPVGAGPPITITSATSPVALTGLAAGTLYQVSVVARCSGTSLSTAATTSLTTTGQPCPIPTGINATSVTATSTAVSVAFTGANPGPGFTLTVLTPGGVAAGSATGATSPLTVTGLTPGTSYLYSLVTNCTGGVVSLPVTGNFATPQPSPTCPPPTGLALSLQTATGATLSFASSAATSYTLTAIPVTGSSPALTFTGSGSPLVLTGLVLNVAYNLSLVSNCSGGTISAPATITFPGLCPAPTTVAVAAITPSQASVSFTPTPGATGYVLTVTPTAGGPALTVVAMSPPVALTGLRPNTAYTVCVVADCGLGNQSASSCASFRTPLATRNADLANLISLHPNPAHHAATLTLPASLTRQAVAVTLSNTLGQVVRAYPAISTSGPAELDLTGLAAGVYQVRLRTGEGVVSKRLLVE